MHKKCYKQYKEFLGVLKSVPAEKCSLMTSTTEKVLSVLTVYADGWKLSALICRKVQSSTSTVDVDGWKKAAFRVDQWKVATVAGLRPKFQIIKWGSKLIFFVLIFFQTSARKVDLDIFRFLINFNSSLFLLKHNTVFSKKVLWLEFSLRPFLFSSS